VTTFRHEIEIDRTPDEVYRYLNDLERLAEWQIGVGIERLGGPAGEVGERIRKTRRTPVGTQSFDLERTASDPVERAYTLTALGGAIEGSTERWSVEESNGRSRVRLVAPTHWHGLMRLLAPVADRVADRQLRRELPLLKAALEAGTHMGA
jgi:carbon monoxide dehydrogenase subunit G